MTNREDRKEGLVDGPDPDLGEEGFFPIVGEPGGAGGLGGRFSLEVGLHQPVEVAGRVGEDRGVGVITEEAVCHLLLNPAIHGVRCGHGGKGDVDPLPFPRGHEPVGEGERRLGLPASGGVFDDEEVRPSSYRKGGSILLEGSRFVKGEEIREEGRETAFFCRGGRYGPLLFYSPLCAGERDSFEVIREGERSLPEREVVLVGSNPVSKDTESRKDP